MATHSTSASGEPGRPSSSTSELFGGIYARGNAAAAVGDHAWLAAMLRVEAALARACAQEGLIGEDAAQAIAAACDPEGFDLAALGREAAESATPVIAIVRELQARVGESVAPAVHLGATSQDVVDTAAMLAARAALAAILADAGAAADAAARLADAHRATPIAGRTLLQQGVPTTFGLKAAGWLDGIGAASAALAALDGGTLAVQMGGPVGGRGPSVAAAVAQELGLAEPALAWHANRVRPAQLAAALGVLAGALSKVARDVTLLAQTEVAEAAEGGEGRGGSSSMPHKRNPVAAVSVLACTQRVPGLVATLLAAMTQEHERAAGAWQAEWGTLTELLRLTGSASAWAADLLGGLEVDAQRMRATAGTDPAPDLRAADELIDRALRAHRKETP